MSTYMIAVSGSNSNISETLNTRFKNYTPSLLGQTLDANGNTISGVSSLILDGGLSYGVAEDSVLCLGESVDLNVQVPRGSKIIGSQLRVDEVISGATTWSADYTEGVAERYICSSKDVAVNTKNSSSYDPKSQPQIIRRRLYDNDLNDDINNVNATLTRNSIAFLPNKTNATAMVEYPANTPRFGTLKRASISDGKIIKDEAIVGGGTDSMEVWFSVGGYVYAIGVTTDDIYRSETGEAPWTRMQTGSFYSLFKMPDDSILVIDKKVSSAQKVFRSIDGCTTLVRSKLSGVDMTLTTNTTIDFWGVHVGSNGTVIMTEYTTASNAETCSVYRSVDNGKSWTRVFIKDSKDPGREIYHWHTSGYHSATKKWLLVNGDETLRALWESTDDGLTWNYFSAWTARPDQAPFQPVYFYDYGDATKILAGSDSQGQIECLDVVTGRLSSLYKDVDLRVNAGYYWLVTKIGDLYYACNYPTHTLPRYSNIIVSDDLETWVPWHQFYVTRTGVSGLTSLFEHNNKIHGKQGEAGHFIASVPSVREIKALALDPPTTNMLSLNHSSIDDSIVGYTIYDGSPSVYRNETFFSSGCLYAGRVGVGTALYGPNTPVISGQYIYGSMWMKTSGDLMYGDNRSEWRRKVNNDSVLNTYMLCDNGYWRESHFPVIAITGNETGIAQWSTMSSHSGNNTNMLADCFQISQSPGRWQIGGTPNSGDVVQWTDTMPTEWTHYLTVFSDRIADDYIYYDGYIASWKSDANNYAELYFDGSEKKLVFQQTLGGVAQPAVTGQPIVFHKKQPLRLVTQFTNTATNLNYNLCGLTGLIANAPMPSLLGSGITFLFGNHNGANLLPMWVSDEVIVNNANDIDTLAVPQLEHVANQNINIRIKGDADFTAGKISGRVYYSNLSEMEDF